MDAGDAAAGHLFDDVATTSEGDALASDRKVAELGEKESGEGFDPGLAGKGPAELGAEVAKGGAAIEGHDAFGVESCRAGGNVELIFEFADHLLEHVFGGDDADSRTEFVDNDGDLATTGLKLLEKFGGELGFGNNKTRRA